MDFKTGLTVIIAILTVVCIIGYQLADRNVYANYKEQKIPFNGKEFKK